MYIHDNDDLNVNIDELNYKAHAILLVMLNKYFLLNVIDKRYIIQLQTLL